MKILGHRGCFYETENTIRSFIRAFELGVDGVELDVQLTSDNYIVVSHDSNLKRLTGLDFDIKKNNFSKLKEIDINGEEVPLLNDVLELVKEKNKLIDIEVKDPDDMRMVCEIVSKFNYEEVIISSFYHKNIFYYKKIYPEIKFAYLYSHEPKNIEEYLNEVDFLKPNINFLTEDYKFYSQKIIPWVANDNRDFEYIRNFNLYGVITDFPDKLKNFLNKKEFSENYFIYYLLKSIIKEESTFNKDFIKITLKNLFQNITINEIKINDRFLNIGKGYPIIWKVGEKLNLNIENFSLNDKLILNVKEIGIFEIELKDLIKILN